MASWQGSVFSFTVWALLGLGILLYMRRRRHLALRPLLVYGYSLILAFLAVFYSIPVLASSWNEQILFQVIVVIAGVAAMRSRWIRNRMYVPDFLSIAGEIGAQERGRSRPKIRPSFGP